MKFNSTFNFDFGGEVRRFRIDMNMLCEVEHELGVRIMGKEKFWKELGFTELRAIAYGMLYAQDPRPDIEQVGGWMSDVDLGEFTEAFMKAFTSDFPKAEPTDGETPQDPTEG